MAITPETIRRIATEMQDYPVEPARAAELAVEVERMNRRVADAAQAGLGFFDEPLDFARALEELRED